MTIAIRVEALSKQYRLGGRLQGPHDSLVDLVGASASRLWRSLSGRRREELPSRANGQLESAEDGAFWALRDVSFDVLEGEVLGIIGCNGAGKSTLLKVLSRITEPTSGRAEIEGRVASLLEIGTGFHPDLTGRENVFLNGSLLGMSRNEIGRKFDEIVSFSGIERFIDTPVKRYSSGMYVRLAFAVAAHLETEIVFLDEVLAVGDADYQRRCFKKMREISTSGRTILFVSHNLASIEALCRNSILMDRGKVLGFGSTREQIARYLERVSDVQRLPLEVRTDRVGTGATLITALEFRDHSGNLVDHVGAGENLAISVHYRSRQAGSQPVVTLSVWTAAGQKVFHVDSDIRGVELDPLEEQGQYSCHFESFFLVEGKYSVNAEIWANHELSDHVESAAVIEVIANDFYDTGRPTPAYEGLIHMEHDWQNGGV